MNKTTYKKRLKQWNDTIELINSYNFKEDHNLISNNFIQFERGGYLYSFSRPVEWSNIPNFNRLNTFKWPAEDKDITFNTFKKNLILELENIKYHEQLKASI